MPLKPKMHNLKSKRRDQFSPEMEAYLAGDDSAEHDTQLLDQLVPQHYFAEYCGGKTLMSPGELIRFARLTELIDQRRAEPVRGAN